MILILDPSSAPAQIHVSSSDQLMQRLSQQSRFNNNHVVAIAGLLDFALLVVAHLQTNRLKQALGTEASLFLGSKQA